ncbi:hypothetical protein CRH02_07730 [Escherichia albertii]|nr:hypothetical protein CRH02_07730 [Escherichia albertii]
MPGSTYQAFHQYLFIFFEFHHKTDKSHTAKNDASMHFFLLATNQRKKFTVSANTLIFIAFYGADNV